ncbi:MAG: hypothetical protein ACXWCU_13825 [Caldimonas sp.]
MTQPTRSAVPRPGIDSVDPTGDWSTAIARTIFDAQRLQWEALLAWQQSLATFSMDLWEQWACRYAGGAPIDV